MSFHAGRVTRAWRITKLIYFPLMIENTNITLQLPQEVPTSGDSFQEVRGVVKNTKKFNGG